MLQHLSSLAGLRILDLSDRLGQFAGRVLAELGAEVVRVEPTGGDPARRAGPFFLPPDGGTAESLSFWHYNLGKKSVVLDAGTAGGAAALSGLIRAAAIVIASGDAVRTLRANCGDALGTLPVIAITAYGVDEPDPERDDPLHVGARSAFAGLSGYGDDAASSPINPDGDQPSHIASLYGVMAAFMALRLGDRARGQVFDVSAQASAFQATEQTFVHWEYRKEPLFRRTGGYATNAPSSRWQFVARDAGLVYNFGLIPRHPESWRKLREWMRREGALEDLDQPEYDDVANLRTVSSHVLPSPAGKHASDVVERFVKSIDAEPLYREAQANGLPWARIYRPEETLNDPHFHERGFFHPLENPATGETYYTQGSPWTFAVGGETVPQGPPLRPPRCGEHTADVLARWLGAAASAAATHDSARSRA